MHSHREGQNSLLFPCCNSQKCEESRPKCVGRSDYIRTSQNSLRLSLPPKQNLLHLGRNRRIPLFEHKNSQRNSLPQGMVVIALEDIRSAKNTWKHPATPGRGAPGSTLSDFTLSHRISGT